MYTLIPKIIKILKKLTMITKIWKNKLHKQTYHSFSKSKLSVSFYFYLILFLFVLLTRKKMLEALYLEQLSSISSVIYFCFSFC